MKKLVLSAAVLAATLPVIPVAAQGYYNGYYNQNYNNGYYNQNYNNGYYNNGYNNSYYNNGYGNGYSARGYNGRVWRGRDGRYYCRRSNGTTGLLVGGVAGALVGRAIDGGRDRTAGTLIGGVAGALLGREVERSSSNGARCR